METSGSNDEQQVQQEELVGTGGQVRQEQPIQQYQPVQPVRHDAYKGKGKRAWIIPLAVSLIVLAVAGASFFGGMKYQESREPAQVGTADASQDGQTLPTQPGGAMGGDMRGGMGAMGEVTEISSSSISIEDIRSGSNSTYTITSSTEILDNGDTAKASDIKVGDSVMVIPSDSDDTVAGQIMIDPGMGGPPGPGATPPSGSADTDGITQPSTST